MRYLLEVERSRQSRTCCEVLTDIRRSSEAAVSCEGLTEDYEELAEGEPVTGHSLVVLLGVDGK